MPHSLPSFHIMPVGWGHAAWQGRFYPEDLPEDWRLSYFANEFPEVLVPQASWIDAGVDQLQSWVDDVSEGFRFFLAISDPLELSLCEQQVEGLGANLGGFVLAQQFAGNGWRDELLAMSRQRNVEVFGVTETNICETLPSFSEVGGMGLALAFIGNDHGDLRTQRGFFEQLQHNVQPDAQILLFFAGNPPAIESILKLRELARLMGLA